MAEHITVSIDDLTGETRFLVSELSRFLLDESSTVKRASHVEPVSKVLRKAFYMLRDTFGETGTIAELTRKLPCLWRVNLSPINGPILPNVYRDRSQAIDAEIVFLEKHFL